MPARISGWVVGVGVRAKSMPRAVRWDGVVTQWQTEGRDVTTGDLRDLRAWCAERGRDDLGVILDGETPADDRAAAAEKVRPWADAGATWWLETRWELPHHSDERMREVRHRLEAGPPSG